MFSYFALVTLAIGFFNIIYPLLLILIKYTIGVNFQSRLASLKNAGEWAIVTGSTDGIGKAMANELAKLGLNIVLISRNASKLQTVASEIQSRHGVKTKIVVADFTKLDIYEQIEQELSDLSSIACLINNVGISYPGFARFDNANFMDHQFISNLIACNCNSMASMTKIVLPKLLSQSTQGSAIINLSSFAGINSIPYLSLYSGSKAFASRFTEALALENGDGKVIFQTLCPYFVATAMTRMKSKNVFVPTPEVYAASALKMLGVEQNSCGYLPHALLDSLATKIPGRVLEMFAAKKIRKPKAN